MPFTKIKGTRYYKSPSGRKWTIKQIHLYYMTKGFKNPFRKKK